MEIIEKYPAVVIFLIMGIVLGLILLDISAELGLVTSFLDITFISICAGSLSLIFSLILGDICRDNEKLRKRIQKMVKAAEASTPKEE